jgi:hypothetical protein
MDGQTARARPSAHVADDCAQNEDQLIPDQGPHTHCLPGRMPLIRVSLQ